MRKFKLLETPHRKLQICVQDCQNPFAEKNHRHYAHIVTLKIRWSWKTARREGKRSQWVLWRVVLFDTTCAVVYRLLVMCKHCASTQKRLQQAVFQWSLNKTLRGCETSNYHVFKSRDIAISFVSLSISSTANPTHGWPHSASATASLHTQIE